MKKRENSRLSRAIRKQKEGRVVVFDTRNNKQHVVRHVSHTLAPPVVASACGRVCVWWEGQPGGCVVAYMCGRVLLVMVINEHSHVGQEREERRRNGKGSPMVGDY